MVYHNTQALRTTYDMTGMTESAFKKNVENVRFIWVRALTLNTSLQCT